MITVTQTPNLVSLAGLRQAYKFESDNIFSTEGVKSQLVLHVTSPSISANQSFTLAWGTISIVFTCKASPNESGEEFGQGNWAVLGAALEANYYVSKDFSVNYATSGYITLKARETGSAYTLTFTNGNPAVPATASTNIAGVTPVMRPNFRIIVRTLHEDDSIMPHRFYPVGEDALTTFINNAAEVDVHEYLMPYFKMEFDFPESDGALIHNRKGMIVHYIIGFAEAYGDTLKVMKLNGWPTHYLLNGGISRELESLYNTNQTQWWSTWISQKRFLTFHPSIKRVSLTSLEKLWYLNVFKYTSIKLKKTVTYFDGTSDASEIIATINSSIYELYEFNCSIPLLLPTSNTDKVARIVVWLTDQDNHRITEIRTFEINHKAQRQSRTFLFLNSLGVYETLHCTGEFEQNTQTESVEALRLLPIGFTNTNAEKVRFNIKENRTLKANTGYQFSEEHQDWLRDFLLSRECYLALNSTKLIPVLIKSDKYTLYRDNQSMYALEFEFDIAYQNEFFSSLTQLSSTDAILPFLGTITAYDYDHKTKESDIGLDTITSEELAEGYQFSCIIDGYLHVYTLTAGENITSDVPTIIIPYDYEYSEKYWLLISEPPELRN